MPRFLTALVTMSAAVAMSVSPAVAHPHHSGHATTLAVIGDTPYGDPQIAGFPRDIAEINADPDVRRVIHLGDIKNGSSRCDDSYFELIRSDFDMFEDPLVYTPGDNEWTDCHRSNNGGYVPTARLAKIRSLFFDNPGRTLGIRSRRVRAQHAPYVENVRWARAHTVFAVVHVVGSNDDLLPWFGAAMPTADQVAEEEGRRQAALNWIDAAFDRAEHRHAAGVVIGMQADMWDPEAIAANAVSAFNPIVAKLAQRSRHFRKPVLLFEGDSHKFIADHPLANGSPVHGVTTAAPNLTRVVVQGSTSVPHEWLRLHVDPHTSSVFSWERVPFAVQP